MRISKLLSEICAAALLAGSCAIHAQDNPDQAAARAALAKTLNELNAQSSPAASQTMTPTAPGGAGDNAAQAAAREALTQKLNAMNSQPSPAASPMTSPAAPVGGGDNAAQAAAREALNKKLGELNAHQAQQVNPGLAPMVMKPSGVSPAQPAQPAMAPAAAQKSAAAVSVQTPKPMATASEKNSAIFTPAAPAKGGRPMPSPATANQNYAGKSLGFAPMEPPPAPVSPEKQAELSALLAKYMANEVSPDEYQKERAAIMAKP